MDHKPVTEKMRQRFEKSCQLITVRCGVVEPPCTGVVVPAQEAVDFAVSEVALALRPREPAPELEEAEWALRTPSEAPMMGKPRRDCIAAELDRLRAEVERLRKENVHLWAVNVGLREDYEEQRAAISAARDANLENGEK
jgi:hypothetical protein